MTNLLTNEELERACESLRESRDALLKRNDAQRAEIARLHATIAEMDRLRPTDAQPKEPR